MVDDKIKRSSSSKFDIWSMENFHSPINYGGNRFLFSPIRAVVRYDNLILGLKLQKWLDRLFWNCFDDSRMIILSCLFSKIRLRPTLHKHFITHNAFGVRDQIRLSLKNGKFHRRIYFRSISFKTKFLATFICLFRSRKPLFGSSLVVQRFDLQKWSELTSLPSTYFAEL